MLSAFAASVLLAVLIAHAEGNNSLDYSHMQIVVFH